MAGAKEEILRYIWEKVDGYDLARDSHCEALAEQLLRDGWCIQVEAEWIPLNDFHNEMYACSNCQLHIHKDLLEHFHFCSKCGAKIVGRR